jgi:hypothetical protein
VILAAVGLVYYVEAKTVNRPLTQEEIDHYRKLLIAATVLLEVGEILALVDCMSELARGLWDYLSEIANRPNVETLPEIQLPTDPEINIQGR